ncbi:MAG: hypothetical protein WAL63_09975 [Solirubrobacteraceae bacterium]
MSATIERTAERIAERGRRELVSRLRAAFERSAARSRVVVLDDAELSWLAEDAAARADGTLWRRSLAEAATAEFGINLAEAIWHPAVQLAHELVGAPPFGLPGEAPAVRADTVRLAAVHLTGIEAIVAGDSDIELCFSGDGVDVFKRSNGAAIGRLQWGEIVAIELPPVRRGLVGGRRRVQELHLRTERARANFEIPGFTEEELRERLDVILALSRGHVT